MKTLAVLLVIFLGIGIFAKTYNAWVRVLLIGVIVAVLLYENFG